MVQIIGLLCSLIASGIGVHRGDEQVLEAIIHKLSRWHPEAVGTCQLIGQRHRFVSKKRLDERMRENVVHILAVEGPSSMILGRLMMQPSDNVHKRDDA